MISHPLSLVRKLGLWFYKNLIRRSGMKEKILSPLRQMMMRLVFAAWMVAGCRAASESQHHYHTGKLTRYEIGPPSVLLSASDESRLRAGRPVMQAVVADDGVSRRMIMVQNIPAPSSVVLGRIMDLNKYDQMVSGVDSNVIYASTNAGSVQSVKSTYEISALNMKFKYFVEHK